jgi:hypothetical protein
MKTFITEGVVSVADFMRGGDPDAAFSRASVATTKAIEWTKCEVRNALNTNRLPRGLTFNAEFVEFDSSNWTHAAGYYNVAITGPDAVIDRIQCKMGAVL